MKILFAIIFAAIPAAASAQAVSDTLDMVQGLSDSAASDLDLSGARESAGKPFSAMTNPSPAVDLQVSGFLGDRHGWRNARGDRWGHGNHGNYPGHHPNPPIIITPYPDHYPNHYPDHDYQYGHHGHQGHHPPYPISFPAPGGASAIVAAILMLAAFLLMLL